MMRQIRDVTGTQDGSHTLVLCTDGSVLYHYAGADPSQLPIMTEVTSLQRNPESEVEMGCVWTLRRVGRGGVVVLVRTGVSVTTKRLSVTVSPLSGNHSYECYFIK